VILITIDVLWFLQWFMCHLSTKFCGNRFISFCVILITKKQTNAEENITSLAELIKLQMSCSSPEEISQSAMLLLLLVTMATRRDVTSNHRRRPCPSTSLFLSPFQRLGLHIKEICRRLHCRFSLTLSAGRRDSVLPGRLHGHARRILFIISEIWWPWRPLTDVP